MTDDFVKEIIEGAGADDPESKTYQIRVRHRLSCRPTTSRKLHLLAVVLCVLHMTTRRAEAQC